MGGKDHRQVTITMLVPQDILIVLTVVSIVAIIFQVIILTKLDKESDSRHQGSHSPNSKPDRCKLLYGEIKDDTIKISTSPLRRILAYENISGHLRVLMECPYCKAKLVCGDNITPSESGLEHLRALDTGNR